MKFKDDYSMHEDSANKHESTFKARPFNRKIFEKSAGKLAPSVEKKPTTHFEEFSLSHSNA
jgi:hypothetical protein